MIQEERNTVPIWLVGVLVALLVILLGTRLSGPRNVALEREFAPRTPDPSLPTSEPFVLPSVDLPSLPPSVQETIGQLRSRFAGGQAVPALTPVAQSARVRVEVRELRRSGEQVEILGTITNTAGAAVAIPAGSFSFRDSTGLLYAVEGGSSSTLQPGASVPLDLSVPLPAGLGLTLILTLPPDPPVQQILVVGK